MKTTSDKNVSIVQGDLLDQDVEAIVNSWNRNIFPYWLLIPQGVSRAIRKRAGTTPFKEVGRAGILPLGAAVLTSAGNLPYKGIIHVAGINLLWMSSERSIRLSTANALAVAKENGFASVAFPLIGAGTGGMSPNKVQDIMLDEFARAGYDGKIVLARLR